MYSRINYTVVGFFVVIFSILAIGFAFWLAKYGFKKSYRYYYIYFSESVDGLSLDSSVKLMGVDVGKVDKIEIDPNNFKRIRVLIRLNRDVKIVQGMYATLKLQGITWLSFIEIEGGKEGAGELIATNGKIPVIPSKESLTSQLSDDAPKLLNKVQNILTQMEKIFSNKNIKELNGILANSNKITKRAIVLEDDIISLSRDFNKTLANLNKKLDTLESETIKLTKSLNSKLPTLLDNFNATTKEVDKLTKELNHRLNRGDYDIRGIVRPIQADISELTYSYKELAGYLKNLSQNPSSVIFGAPKPPRGPGE